jgi:hypothetical protein
MDEGEFEKLEAEEKNNPQWYCCHNGDDSVVACGFNGGNYVFGCDCKWEEKLEKLLITNQREFVAYYKAKIARDLKKAQESIANLAEL